MATGMPKGIMISSIPDGVYFAFVTFAQVGYGDKYPQTIPGKAVGCVALLMGGVVLSLPLAVLASKFSAVRDAAQNPTKRSAGQHITISVPYHQHSTV